MKIQNSSLIVILGCICATMSLSEGNRVLVQPFGKVNGEEIKKFTLRNSKNQEVDVISYGATITAVRTPDKTGKVEDVVLGFDNIEGYLSKDNPYFGATVGRVANRIANGRFQIDGVQYQVSQNIGNNTLHGGFKGWNSKVWNTVVKDDTVVMTVVSEDGDEGFPGTVSATASFKLDDDGNLIIDMTANTTGATPINLTNHGYFNLAGQGTNAAELYQHVFILNAVTYTVTDEDSIPTGEIRPVDNSIMDLRQPTVLGNVINLVPGGGFDNNFCVTGSNNPNEKKFVSKVLHPTSGRTLEVFSNQPGVQLYTANYFPAVGEKGIHGKSGSSYFKHAAFCLETQNYPDAVNHKNFPNSILRPGNGYNHIVVYKFGVEI